MRRLAVIAALLAVLLALTGCGGDGATAPAETVSRDDVGGAQVPSATDPAPSTEPAGATFVNPVIPGQQPDPTVLRDGETYWAATTSRSWAPVFPLYRSADLVNWERVGAVLDRAPTWSAGPYWAPELTRGDGETRVYYTARPRARRETPCIGAASAATPAGPYRDRGPVLCPPAGAIDAFATRDEQDRPYLLYRQFRDGGGIWAVRLTADGLDTTGRPRQLIRATAADDSVVEAPELVRRDGRFVLLFASGRCCSPPCDYREAAAQSDALLGPYVRAPGLVLRGNDRWRCPGHGTLVDTPAGATYYLHHAVAPDDPVNARRTALLEPVVWDPDGWPLIGDDGTPVAEAPSPLGVTQVSPATPLAPDLASPTLDVAWEWPWDQVPRVRPSSAGLRLAAAPAGAVLARQIPAGDVRTEVRVRPQRCAAGLAAVTNTQDGGEAIGIELGQRLRIWRGRTARGAGRTIATAPAPAAGERLSLAATVVDGGRRVRFAARGASGRWRAVGPTVAGTSDVHRFIRSGLTCRGGARDAFATFDRLSIEAVG